MLVLSDHGPGGLDTESKGVATIAECADGEGSQSPNPAGNQGLDHACGVRKIS